MPTLTLARRHGAGVRLINAAGDIFRVDNWSNGTKQVWGQRSCGADDSIKRGKMELLADNLEIYEGN